MHPKLRAANRLSRSDTLASKWSLCASFDLFIETYKAKYPKATECLKKDREELLAFYDFPAEHWIHLRTTNPIESVFATVKHRQKKTHGNGSRKACLARVFKLAESASKKWQAAGSLTICAGKSKRTKLAAKWRESAGETHSSLSCASHVSASPRWANVPVVFSANSSNFLACLARPKS